jgi:hypothetical protein
MAATVKIQPQGFSIQYPKTPWRVIFVEHSSGKFYFRLSSEDFWFEPRDRYRYPSHDDARRAAHGFLELMKRLDRSKKKLSILAEIGVLKFPQGTYRSCQLWLVVDRTRCTWEIFTVNGLCLRSQYWYKHPNTALIKAKAHIDRELAITQIVEVVGWA